MDYEILDFDIDLSFLESELVDNFPDPKLEYLITVLDAVANPEVENE